MDWFPLYNSLRIAVISSVLVFFFRNLCSLLYRKAASGDQRRVGCDSYPSNGFTTDRSRIFYPAAVGFQKTIWTLVLSYFWNETGYELVFRYFCCYSGSLSTDVPYCAGGL